mgnify:CR=1 FL=1
MGQSHQRILVIRLSSIGDILHCTGIPRHLKLRFPNAEIHWVVRADNQELITGNPYISKIYAFNRPDGILGWFKLAKELKEKITNVEVDNVPNTLRSP